MLYYSPIFASFNCVNLCKCLVWNGMWKGRESESKRRRESKRDLWVISGWARPKWPLRESRNWLVGSGWGCQVEVKNTIHNTYSFLIHTYKSLFNIFSLFNMCILITLKPKSSVAVNQKTYRAKLQFSVIP